MPIRKGPAKSPAAQPALADGNSRSEEYYSTKQKSLPSNWKMTVTEHSRVEEDMNEVVLETLEPKGLRPLILKIFHWWNMPGLPTSLYTRA
jgi:hypothetical protein